MRIAGRITAQGVRSFGRLMISGLLALGPPAGAAQPETPWVPSWTAAPQLLDPIDSLPAEQLDDATLRQTIRLSIGGSRIRICLSNAFSDQPLAITGIHVGLSGSASTAAILAKSDREVHFGGRRNVMVPPGGTTISDKVQMPVPPLARLSISIHFANAPLKQTGHRRSRSTSWLAPGNQLDTANLAAAAPFEHWYFLSAIRVEAPRAHVIVALGDSVTDGSGSTPDQNNRWPDLLAERLQSMPSIRQWAVANQGIAGNQLLADGFGPSALARFDQDVLSQPHVRTVLLQEGINDLGQFALAGPHPAAAHETLVAQIIKANEQLIARAHARGLRIVAATIMPYGGSDYHPANLDEADRCAVNQWIRTRGQFDAVVDWDALLRDPDDPTRLNPAYDWGDHIHPSPAGHRAMVEAIPLEALTK